MRRFAIVLFFSSLALAQQSSTTSAPCSPIAPENTGTITINCPGLSKEQGQKMLTILNKILTNQIDADTVITKLDDIQKGIGAITSRAHLEVEEVAVDVETINGFPVNLHAHISGHNRSPTDTLENPTVRGAIVVSPPVQSAKEEQAMFDNPSNWSSQGYVKLNGRLYSQQEFTLDIPENLSLLDGDEPWSRKTANALREGKLIVYVFTKAIYADKYGRVPESRSCRGFHFDQQRQRFTQAGSCYLVILGSRPDAEK
jgi:hypothetical protein